ncbi:phage tail sheath family protein [Lacinutrix sp. WUR7]|uniref:phage tail sheath family protein n=1 Tax=Lacinutrix sp. WUR7 TaxID=2653681 RepID=UPI00193D387B|nr:phage tail sheath C-terminal domain-containing protein [Lacinutrix sp. WUR7]QRM88190.1 phage tail sheath family protein [Lacinutrix sp. WUR7]
MTAKLKTPGVYIQEVNAFPNSVVPVPTAVPAFVGYTPQAYLDGKTYFNVPTKIKSFAEFQAIFCYPETPTLATPKKQYHPEYYLVKQQQEPEIGSYMKIAGDFYAILPDANTIYYMYNSVRLFYENGGSDAYIVSVGSYGSPSKKPIRLGEPMVNRNVRLNDLQNGIALLKKESEPTMYICPDATLLSVANNGALMEVMLLQNSEMETAISIFDVIGGNAPDPIMYTDDIESFRNNTGVQGLSYGCAYYPFIGTIIMQETDIDFTNLFGGDIKALESILLAVSDANEKTSEILKIIENPKNSDLTTAQLNEALLNASPTYSLIIRNVLAEANMLPPSGAIAGVITRIDNQEGVWKAPANTSIVSVVSLPIELSSEQQQGLNVDAVSGKSINAIRVFNGIGILIWGARTLDGNSNDWKYLPVRRTLIFLEQSCKLATQAYMFEANDTNTWKAVKGIINNFLVSIWREGGLVGSRAEESFFVRCGLGETMTSQDILNGVMIVQVGVAVIHPAEFIVFSFQQEMKISN